MLLSFLLGLLAGLLVTYSRHSLFRYRPNPEVDVPSMDAAGSDTSWESTREGLEKAVRANFRDWFQLNEDSESENCLTSERMSAGAMLDEFSMRIREFASPPFMLQRLTELAHLTHNASSQYKRHEGFKYLDAVLKATRVRSSIAVFDSFETEISTEKLDLRPGIKLSGVSWLDGVDLTEALNDAHMSLESPEYM